MLSAILCVVLVLGGAIGCGGSSASNGSAGSGVSSGSSSGGTGTSGGTSTGGTSTGGMPVDIEQACTSFTQGIQDAHQAARACGLLLTPSMSVSACAGWFAPCTPDDLSIVYSVGACLQGLTCQSADEMLDDCANCESQFTQATRPCEDAASVEESDAGV